MPKNVKGKYLEQATIWRIHYVKYHPQGTVYLESEGLIVPRDEVRACWNTVCSLLKIFTIWRELQIGQRAAQHLVV